MKQLLYTRLFFLFCLLACFPSVAQTELANAASLPPALAPAASDEESGNSETMVLTGKITNPAGPLPGAVVILTATRQMAVTNAEGEFELVVPTTATNLEARVTYAGFADEKMLLNPTAGATTSLTNAQVIVVSRRFQMKAYERQARKEVRHSLREIR